MINILNRKNKLENGLDMEFTTFVRKPFVVQAVEVTSENINEVAKYIGDVREREDGTKYILVDRRLVPNVFKVYRLLHDEDGREHPLLLQEDLQGAVRRGGREH